MATQTRIQLVIRAIIACTSILTFDYSMADDEPPWIVQPTTKICIDRACLGMSIDQLPEQDVWEVPEMHRIFNPEIPRNYYVELSKLQYWCPYVIGRKFTDSVNISGKIGEDHIKLRAIALPKTKASSHSNFAVVKLEFTGPVTKEEFTNLPELLIKTYPTLKPQYVGNGSLKAFTALMDSTVTLSVQPYVPLNPEYVSSQFDRTLKIMALWRIDRNTIPEYHTKLQEQEGCEWPKDPRTNALKALTN